MTPFLSEEDVETLLEMLFTEITRREDAGSTVDPRLLRITRRLLNVRDRARAEITSRATVRDGDSIGGQK